MSNNNIQNQKVTQSIVLFVWATAVFFCGQWYREAATPMSVIHELTANCMFSPPGEYRFGPYANSIKWCEGVSQRPYQTLMNHIEVETGGVNEGMYIGAEFGGNVQLVYHPSSRVFMFNPRVVAESGESILCQDEVGGGVIEAMRASVVDVEFISGREGFKKAQIRFEDGDACLLQSILTIL